MLRSPDPVLMRGVALSIRPREFKPHGRKTKRNDTSTEEAEVTRDDDSTHEVKELYLINNYVFYFFCNNNIFVH